MRATAYCVLRSARLLELPSAHLLCTTFSYFDCVLHTSIHRYINTSVQLLHRLRAAYISTSTANCIHQYIYCIVLLQDNHNYLLPAAFISTFTANYIHQYIYCQVQFISTRATPFGTPGSLEKDWSLLRRKRIGRCAFGPATPTSRNIMPASGGVRCDSDHMS